MFKILTVVVILVAVMSCKKDKTTWSSNWSGPITHGTLKLDDLIDSNYQKTNSEGYVSLVFNEPLYTFSVDTLIELPDTTIATKYAFSIPSLTVTPEFSLDRNRDQKYDLGEIVVKKVLIKSGSLIVKISSPWSGKSTLDFSFPNVKKSNENLARSYDLEAASILNESSASETIDLSGYIMDLTGSDGNQINTIEGLLTLSSNEPTNNYNITNKDSVTYEISFKDLVPQYAQGYFGSYAFSDTTGVKLPIMDKILSGNIDLDSIDLNLSIRNGFNLISQAKITKVSGINTRTNTEVDLLFPLLNNSVNINPATGGFYDFVASNYSIRINNRNSNVLDFVENLSDSIRLGYELKINPFGNLSGGHDEVFPGSTFDLYLEGEFPMSFAANGLTLSDTFHINYTVNNSIKPSNGEIKLTYINAFPLNAQAFIDIIDDNGNMLGSLTSAIGINAGTSNISANSTTPVSGTTTFIISEKQLESIELADHLVLYVQLGTENGNKIKITPSDYFDFNVTTNLDINLSL